MDVNDNACCLNKRAALQSIASKLAPTLGPGAIIVRSGLLDQRVQKLTETAIGNPGQESNQHQHCRYV